MTLEWQSPILSLLNKKKVDIEPLYIRNLKDAGIKKIEDLLWIIPLRSRTIQAHIDDCEDGDIYSFSGKIRSIRSFRNFRAKGRNRVPLSNITALVEIENKDETKVIELRWFNAYPNIEKSLRSKEMQSLHFYGTVKKANEKFQIINPKLQNINSESVIEYPTINSVPGKKVASLIKKIPNEMWSNISPIIYLPQKTLTLSNSFKKIHGIENNSNSFDEALDRIIVEEFLKEQVLIEKRKFLREQKKHSYSIKVTNKEKNKIYTSFPFPLTNDQKNVINEIAEDYNSGFSMSRLIQGDVGCGKTAVAFAACQIIINAGFQAAIMAPTESLATQLFSNAKTFFNSETSINLLIGSTNKKNKDLITNNLENGSIQLIIGTHALIQKGVNFKSLALSIIDEQHKFGVKQRIALNKKSITGHTLIMSATPIPRSLSLTKFGDLDISIIREKPNGRLSIPSRIINHKTMDKFFSFLLTRIEMGEQVYVVAPAIDESETIDIENLQNIYSKLSNLFPSLNIGLIHGKLSSDEKKLALEEFKDKKIDILVSTSIIEVGIDVENATTMVVYGPERFGLSSLHQLRGRVGRGAKPGFFFMIIEKNISQESMKRLQVIEDYSDGFKIAEQDLIQRGEGDILGINQSGEKNRRIADITKHQALLQFSIEAIEEIKQNDSIYFNKLMRSNDHSMEEFTV
jgi:ATP-dependent DNA helicase RecG